MKNKSPIVFLMAFLVCASACGKAESIDPPEVESENVIEEQTETEAVTEADVEKQTDTENEDTQSIDDGVMPVFEGELTNTYITRNREINGVSCPTFEFDYPDNWSITAENYDVLNAVSEQAILTDDRGGTITYMAHRDLGYQGSDMVAGEIVKVADSQFVPYYPEGTDKDLSSLAPFVVAQMKITESLFMGEDEDYHEVECTAAKSYYAVIPEQQLGEFTDIVGLSGITDRLSFDYPQPYVFMAEPPEGGWTDEELAEVIAILSSFRVQ